MVCDWENYRKIKIIYFLAAKCCHECDEQYQSVAELRLALVINDFVLITNFWCYYLGLA